MSTAIAEHDKVPDKPCWNCKGTKFWKTPYGRWLCNSCHPNPNPKVNTTEVDINK